MSYRRPAQTPRTHGASSNLISCPVLPDLARQPNNSQLSWLQPWTLPQLEVLHSRLEILKSDVHPRHSFCYEPTQHAAGYQTDYSNRKTSNITHVANQIRIGFPVWKKNDTQVGSTNSVLFPSLCGAGRFDQWGNFLIPSPWLNQQTAIQVPQFHDSRRYSCSVITARGDYWTSLLYSRPQTSATSWRRL